MNQKNLKLKIQCTIVVIIIMLSSISQQHFKVKSINPIMKVTSPKLIIVRQRHRINQEKINQVQYCKKIKDNCRKATKKVTKRQIYNKGLVENINVKQCEIYRSRFRKFKINVSLKQNQKSRNDKINHKGQMILLSKFFYFLQILILIICKSLINYNIQILLSKLINQILLSKLIKITFLKCIQKYIRQLIQNKKQLYPKKFNISNIKHIKMLKPPQKNYPPIHKTPAYTYQPHYGEQLRYTTLSNNSLHVNVIPPAQNSTQRISYQSIINQTNMNNSKDSPMKDSIRQTHLNENLTTYKLIHKINESSKENNETNVQESWLRKQNLGDKKRLASILQERQKELQNSDITQHLQHGACGKNSCQIM